MSQPLVLLDSVRSVIEDKTGREGWTEYLKGRITSDWRPGEFDPESLLYIPNPDLADTYISRCSKAGCDIRVVARLCPSCLYERKRLEVEFAEGFDVEAWLEVPRVKRVRTLACGVPECQRTALTVGLCASHRSNFWNWRKRTGSASRDQWFNEQKPRPLPPAEQKCQALICGNDAHGVHNLCDPHEGSWRKWSKRRGDLTAKTESVDEWLHNYFELPLSAEQVFSYAELAATPFHLLRPPIRWEYLFAVQQRDLELHARMVPLDIRRAYQGLRNIGHESLVGLDQLGLEAPHSNVRGLYRDLQMRIDEAHRQWLGEDRRERGVYYYRDLDLTPSVKPVSRTAKFDLRNLKVEWWKETLDTYLLEGGPHGRSRVQNLATLAEIVDTVLHQRGTPAEALSRADADAIVRAIRKRWPSEQSQRVQTATLKSLLAFARLNADFLPIWRRISSGFDVDPARHRPAGTPPRGRRNDDAYRFIPQPIVDWLMDHLHLLKRNTRLQTMEGRMMVYLHERCGRRTIETVKLRNDCISYDSAGQAYLEWDRGKPPYGPGPRLPIHQDVHDAIRDWQQIKGEFGIHSEWLFPTPRSRQDKPHGPMFLRDRIRDLVEAVIAEAPYGSEVEGADGNLTYFDIRSIDAYAFRHAFAQRHADATDENGRSTFSPEELQRWMGHRSFDTTMGYFVITARRQRRAMSALPSRRLDFQGNAVTVDRERDGFGKLAVSLGSCTEPMNVAAGGEACALAHACESCPFFLVDPFERDGLASKRLYLQAQIERVKVIAPDSHMIQHYQLRVADCSRIIDGIDSYIERLPQEERHRIEEALERMADMRRRATAHRRIDLRQILREN